MGHFADKLASNLAGLFICLAEGTLVHAVDGAADARFPQALDIENACQFFTKL